LIPKIKAWGDGGYGYFTFAYIGVQLPTEDADAWVMVFLGGGPIPPVPPDAWKEFVKCLTVSWNPKDIPGSVLKMFGCLRKFLEAQGWTLTLAHTGEIVRATVKRKE
jgi:hypothetical protein